MKQILYKEVIPAEELRQYILNYWYFEYTEQTDSNGSPPVLEHLVPPDACASIVFMKNTELKFFRTFISVPTIKESKVSVPSGSVFIGIRIMPGIFRSLFSLELDQYHPNQIENILDRLGLQTYSKLDEVGDSLIEQLNQTIYENIANKSIEIDSQIQTIVSQILDCRGNIKVRDIVDKYCINERTLQRKFSKSIGLSPSEFIRIRKVRAAIIDFVLNNKDYLSIAHDHGFSDQSHLIKELRNITGEIPSTLRAYLSQIKHIGDIS